MRMNMSDYDEEPPRGNRFVTHVELSEVSELYHRAPHMSTKTRVKVLRISKRFEFKYKYRKILFPLSSTLSLSDRQRMQHSKL